jgi:peptidoglycan/xylan/chitin deacetylase (PgdA/CDA1 family)
LRGRLFGGGLVLLYHRVHDDAGDPARDPFGLAVSPHHFEQHLEVLRRRARVVSLAELGRRAAAGELEPRTVALTFDDGYRDVLAEGAPRLVEAAFPATVFVVTGGLGEPFWWDELTARLPAGDRKSLRRWHVRLRGLDDEARRLALGELAGPGVPEGDGRRALDLGELRRLAQLPGLEIGFHTVGHPPLAGLGDEALEREVVVGKVELEGLLGHPVRSFSYPYGTAADIDPRAEAAVARAAFERACTNRPGRVGRRTPALSWPRLWVPDEPGTAFARRLDRWLGTPGPQP